MAAKQIMEGLEDKTVQHMKNYRNKTNKEKNNLKS